MEGHKGEGNDGNVRAVVKMVICLERKTERERKREKEREIEIERERDRESKVRRMT